MNFELRSYEIDWLLRIQQCPAQRVLVVGPMGVGKTVMAAALIKSRLAEGARVLFVVHRRELAVQAVEKLRTAGIRDVGVLMGAIAPCERDFLRVNDIARVQVASIQALTRRGRRELPRADLIVIDEAHHALAKSYVELVKQYPTAQVYGLTATPYRLDGKPLGKIFDEIVASAAPSALIDAGWLMRPRVYTVPAKARPDLSGVRKKRGDYDLHALGEAVDKRALVGDIVAHWFKHAENRPTVCYAVNLRHGQHIVDAFVEAGVTAELLDWTVSATNRILMLERLVAGDLSVIVNCNVLTEGWDCPEAKVAIVARPTLSSTLWFQMAGRVTRPIVGAKPPIVLDHAGNALVHGLPLHDFEYSLHLARIQKRPSHVVREWTCPDCGNALRPGVSECGYCGHVFYDRLAEPLAVDGELEWLRPSPSRAFARCNYPECPKPGVPVKSLRGQLGPHPMHKSCQSLVAQAKRKVHCVYKKCRWPNKPIWGGPNNKSQMHWECFKASKGMKPRQHKRCEWDKCPMPERLIAINHRSKGKRPILHRACALQAAAERLEEVMQPLRAASR